MAEAESPSTRDLLLLILGLYSPKDAPPDAQTGRDYWLTEPTATEGRKLRESVPNLLWFEDPKREWNKVRFRDWLIGTLIENFSGHKHSFTAVSEPLVASLDVLGKEFRLDMRGATEEVKKILTSDSKKERSVLSTLTIGLSKLDIRGSQVFVLGAGMRRRARVFMTESEAIQADVEFLVPFYELPNSERIEQPFISRSICAGIAISQSSGSSIGVDEDEHEVSAIRFNLRIPFSFSSVEGELQTKFAAAELRTEKRILNSSGKGSSEWQEFSHWKGFVKEFLKKSEAQELMKAPIGPLLIGEIDDDAELEKVFITTHEVKTRLEEARKELDESNKFLKSLKEYKPSKKDKAETHFSVRTLGSMLESLGLMSAESEYSFKLEKGLTEWDVVNRILRELDGYPLFLSGVESGSDKTRIALALASVEPEPKKTFFGLGGIAYNMPINLVSEKPAKQDQKDPPKSDEKAAQRPEEYPESINIVASDDSFSPGPSHRAANADPRSRGPIVLPDTDDDEGGDLSEFESLSKDEEAERKDKRPDPKDKPPDAPKPRDEKLEPDRTELRSPNLRPASEPKEAPPGPKDVKPEPTPEQEEEKHSNVAIYLHFGKWLSGETLDDNWFRRLIPLGENNKPRVPIPGIRVLPIKRLNQRYLGNEQATFSWSMLFDLVSFGVDIKSKTKEGFKFLEQFADRFRVGAFEVRFALRVSAEDVNREKDSLKRIAFGVTVKCKDVRLSFAPAKKEDKDKGGDEIGEGLQELLSDDWVAVPPPPVSEETELRTRLTKKSKDKFSISVGYLTPPVHGRAGTLDVQLYDSKGKRGKIISIPIDRQMKFIYVKQIGIALEGVENIDLSKGLPDSAKMAIALTGGIRLPVFALGFIGAKLTFQLNNPNVFSFGLEGLDVSLKIGPVVISGGFFRSGFEYAGSLTVDFKKASFSAMGFYGSIVLCDMKSEKDIVADLKGGKINQKLLKVLKEEKVTPRATTPVKKGIWSRQWDVYTTDNEVFTVAEEDGTLTILRPDKTFFVYAMLAAQAGCGPTFGPIQFTGIAFGYGFNRKVKIPEIEEVAEFPLVKAVMGEGGLQNDHNLVDLRSTLGKPIEDPMEVLEKMGEVIVAAKGQQFACAGARFTVAGVVDCFALLIVQWGEEFEISLLGLARFRHPRDVSARTLCYIEMQILASVKPREGTFKLLAQLTDNSWIIHPQCKLTGGFALCVWFAGDHKGDVVLTLGGYHPCFRRPEHYPLVPRLGLNWKVDDKLTVKGGIYLAFTPSCGMIGGKFEAIFHTARVSAWFTAYLDAIVNWEPLFFEVKMGISTRVEIALGLSVLEATIGASVIMWGPPFGGIAHVDVVFVSFDIPFGKPRPQKPALLEEWEQFCNKFLNMSGGERRSVNAPVKAFPIIQPNLAGGASNLNHLPNARREQKQIKAEDGIWKVRADEVEFTASTVVPITCLKVGTVATASPPKGVLDRELSGQSLMAPQSVELVSTGIWTKHCDNKLGVHPMGKQLQSVFNVTIVRDDNPNQPGLSDWTIEEETSSLPAALWDPAVPDSQPSAPSAKLIKKCITGIKRLKPPAGSLGREAPLPQVTWQPLEKATVMNLQDELQEIPTATRSRNVQTVITDKRMEQKAIDEALLTAGFNPSWQPMQPGIRFRDLQAEPLEGSVAAVAER